MPTEARVPILYHPTNVMLIDDDRAFLNNISAYLGHTIPFILESEPKKAFDYLRTHTYSNDDLSALVSQQSFNIAEEQKEGAELFNVNFSTLQSQLNTPNRYKKIVTVFVDKSMPEMDGFEFCHKVKEAGLPVKLILFTGIAGVDEAVNAFNEGIIDAYLPKDAPDITNTINQYIESYSLQKFLDLSSAMSGLISHMLKPIYDEQFYHIFNKICKEHKFIEFYLLDSSCSFLMITNDGQAKCLLVRSEADFEEVYDIARDSKAPYDVLQAIRERQVFPGKTSPTVLTKLQGDAWEDIVIPVDKIPGREWYHALVDFSKIEIHPFNTYFNEVWPEP